MSRFLAHFFSIIFHPMLVPTWAILLMLGINPYAFGVHGFGDAKVIPLILMLFFSTFLIPAVGVLLLKPLGFIDSYQLETQKERHGPYIISGIFYLWVLKNVMSKGLLPPLYTAFLLGATLGLFMAFFVNIFFKISAHAIGMGGLVMAVLFVIWKWNAPAFEFGPFLVSLNLVLVVVVLISGIVGTSRLVLQAHNSAEIYSGFLVGAAAMCVAVSLIG
jgi:hypothetical protein